LKQITFSQKKIEDKKNEILKIREKNKFLSKEMEKNTFKIYELESNIYQLTKKVDIYVDVFNIPVNPPLSWIKKSDEVAELHKKIQKVTTEKEFKEIREKIKKIDKEMKIIWDSKKIEKIYEEILPINNRVYFITSFQHIDNSITEKIMYFQQLIDGDIQIINQIKKYENINEYKKDITLIEDISTKK